MHRARWCAQRFAVDEDPALLTLGRDHAHAVTAHAHAVTQRAGRRVLLARVGAQVVVHRAPARVHRRAAAQLVTGEPQHLLGRVVGIHDHTGGVLFHHAGGQRVEQRAQPLALVHLLGDLGLHRDEAADRAGGVVQRLDVDVQPVAAAVLAAVQQFHPHALALRKGRPHAGHGGGVGLGGLQQRAGHLADGLGQRVAADAGEGLVGPGDAALRIGDDHRVVRALGHQCQAGQLARLVGQAVVLAAQLAGHRLHQRAGQAQQQQGAQHGHGGQPLQGSGRLVAGMHLDLLHQRVGGLQRLLGLGLQGQVLHGWPGRPVGQALARQVLRPVPEPLAGVLPAQHGGGQRGRQRRQAALVIGFQQGLDAQRLALRAFECGVQRGQAGVGAGASHQRHPLRQHALRAGQVDQFGVGAAALLAAPGAPAGQCHQHADQRQRAMHHPAQVAVGRVGSQRGGGLGTGGRDSWCSMHAGLSAPARPG